MAFAHLADTGWNYPGPGLRCSSVPSVSLMCQAYAWLRKTELASPSLGRHTLPVPPSSPPPHLCTAPICCLGFKWMPYRLSQPGAPHSFLPSALSLFLFQNKRILLRVFYTKRFLPPDLSVSCLEANQMPKCFSTALFSQIRLLSWFKSCPYRARYNV